METLNSLRERALSERVGTVCAAISEMVRLRAPLLSAADVAALEERHSEHIGGWLFVYRFAWSEPETHEQLLISALASENPRVREHACDLIGDLKLTALMNGLQSLTADPEPYVAEAARYNYAALA